MFRLATRINGSELIRVLRAMTGAAQNTQIGEMTRLRSEMPIAEMVNLKAGRSATGIAHTPRLGEFDLADELPLRGLQITFIDDVVSLAEDLVALTTQERLQPHGQMAVQRDEMPLLIYHRRVSPRSAQREIVIPRSVLTLDRLWFTHVVADKA